MAAALPIVDLRDFSTPADLAEVLLRVGSDPGFFYVVGHDLGDKVAEEMFDLATSFFDCPTKEKQLHANGSGDLGYTGMREESLSGKGSGDVKESFYLSDPGDRRQLLPPQLEAGREKTARFFNACSDLSKTLLEAFAIGLGVGCSGWNRTNAEADQAQQMPPDFFSKAHSGECCRMRLIKYPPVEMTPPPEGADADDGLQEQDIRAGAHSDYGSLTLLFRQPSDQGGLQVLLPGGTQAGDRWVDVPCLKDAIVVNIGDALEFWTAGRLRSTVHQVAFPRCARENVARLSIPFFVQPDRDVILEPWLPGDQLRGCSANGEAEREFLKVLKRKGYPSTKPVTSHEHLARRIKATYRRS